MFSLLTYEDTCEPAIQQIKISGIPPLVQAISNIVTKKLKTDIVHYEMQFLSCTSNMDLHQIKHIMEKHRQKCNSKRKSEKVLIMYAVYAIECCMRNQLKTS